MRWFHWPVAVLIGAAILLGVLVVVGYVLWFANETITTRSGGGMLVLAFAAFMVWKLIYPDKEEK